MPNQGVNPPQTVANPQSVFPEQTTPPAVQQPQVAPQTHPAPQAPQPVQVPTQAGQQVVYGQPATPPQNYGAVAQNQVHAQQTQSAFNPVPQIEYDGAIPDVARPVHGTHDDIMQYTPSSENFWSGVKGIISIVMLVVTAFLLAGAINRFVFQSYQVFGRSMQTTLATDDRLIVNKLSKSLNNLIGSDYVPDRFDVIVFDSEKESNGQLVKRVLGLPGERVVVERGIITVFNDEFPEGFNPDIEEAFADNLPPENERTGEVEITLAADELFVAGDNRTSGSSLDSRNSLGPVKLDEVVGKVSLRIFPLAESRTF